MNHVWGLFSHPYREMQVIKGENETVSHHYTHHVLIMAAIPVICAFIGTTQIGWDFDDGNVVKLSLFTGFALAILFYGLMLAGVAVMGRVIWWMARNYPQRPSLTNCMVFAGYVATPIFEWYRRAISHRLAVRAGGDAGAVLYRLSAVRRGSGLP